MSDNFSGLTSLHGDLSHVIRTAHRGASVVEPENTMCAMREAIRRGADIIEFDLRMTRDGVPVLLHDETIDRTSDGKGRPEEYSLAELKKFNFSYFYQRQRHAAPRHAETAIPTFEEVLSEFRGQAGMNIQIYVGGENGLREVVRLYRKYAMYDHGYLAIGSTAEAESVRRIDPDVEIALLPGWRERGTPQVLRACRDFGCRFVQPVADAVTPETFQCCRELNLRETVFFADTPEELRRLYDMGARGVMTNRIGDLDFGAVATGQ